MTTKAPRLATEADRTIGRRIATLRVARGLSQTALGDAIGVSFQQVQKYEKGLNRVGAGRLQTIADLLKVPMDTFFADQSKFEGESGDFRTSLKDPQVVELLTAFAAIADATIRTSVLSIVEGAASIHRERAAKA